MNVAVDPVLWSLFLYGRHGRGMVEEDEEWNHARKLTKSLFQKGPNISSQKLLPGLWKVCDQREEPNGSLKTDCHLIDCNTGTKLFTTGKIPVSGPNLKKNQLPKVYDSSLRHAFGVPNQENLIPSELVALATWPIPPPHQKGCSWCSAWLLDCQIWCSCVLYPLTELLLIFLPIPDLLEKSCTNLYALFWVIYFK